MASMREDRKFPNPLLSCTICNKTFKNRSSVLIHNRIHTGERPYKCTFCERTFMYLSSINCHLVSAHRQGANTKMVPKNSDIHTGNSGTEANINSKPKGAKRVTFSPPPIVNRKPGIGSKQKQIDFLKSSKGKKSSNVWPTDGRYKCNLCPRSFENIRGLNGHRHQHYKPGYNAGNEFNCSKCGKVFGSLDAVVNHQSVHEENRFYKCDQCGIAFRHKASLTCHVRVHSSSDRPFKCHKCNKTFKTNFQLRFHQHSSHAPASHTCTVCGRTFTQTYKLEIHMRSHKSGSSFRCGLCDNMFPTLDLFTKHKEIHLKPKSCPTCKKRFSDSTHLMIHMRTHSNERPFSCATCGDTFKQSHHLKVHLAIHIDREGRPHKCVECGASFSQTHLLKKHIMKVHWKEDDQINKMKLKEASKSKQDDIPEDQDEGNRLTPKEHFCDICGAAFTRRYNLAVHIEKHLGTTNKNMSQNNTNSAVKTVGYVPRVQPFEMVHFAESKYTSYKNRRTRPLKQVTIESSDVERKQVREKILSNYYVPRSLVTAMDRDPSTGRTVYVCEVCSTTFTFKENLIRHIRNRLFDHGFYLRKKRPDGGQFIEETPLPPSPSPPPETSVPLKVKTRFYCDICGVSYSRKNNMNMHRRRHSDIEFKEAGIVRLDCDRQKVTDEEEKSASDTVVSSTIVDEVAVVTMLETDTSQCPVYMDRDEIVVSQQSSKSSKDKTRDQESNDDKTGDKNENGENANSMDGFEFDQYIDNDFTEYSSDETNKEKDLSVNINPLPAENTLTVGENKECIGCKLPILNDQTTMTCQLCCQKHCMSCSGVPKNVYTAAFADVSLGFVWMCAVCRPMFPKLTVLLEQMGDFEQAINNRMSDVEKKISVIKKQKNGTNLNIQI